MERIGVVGLSWRQGGPRALARFTVPVEEREDRLPELARAIGAEELVYLATCNRVEVAFVTSPGTAVSEYRRRVFRSLRGREPEPGEAEQALRAWAGEGAAEHLFLVATGLDSARIGETEISGQVRDALSLARRLSLANGRLSLLFEEALKLARRTGSRTALSRGRTSLAELALDRARARLVAAPGVVAMIGVSPMTERCAKELAAEGAELLVVNRSAEPAARLAASLNDRARPLELDEFRADPPPITALISATGAPGVLFGEPELRRLVDAAPQNRPPLVLDLAVPPDVDPEAARALGIARVGMEEIIAAAERNREARVREMGEARELVDEALDQLQRRLGAKTVDRAIAALQRRYEATALDQTERLLRSRFGDLDEERRDLLRRFSTRLAHHFAHLPSTGLRETALAFGSDAVKRFFAHGDRSLARELDSLLEGDGVFSALENDRSGDEDRSGDGNGSGDEHGPGESPFSDRNREARA